MTTGRELDVNLSALLGLNNRRPDFRLRTRDGVFLRAAANTVISDAGTAKRRSGYTQAFSGANCHSLWADRTTDTGFYADGVNLYRVRSGGSGLARELVANDLAPGRALTYARVGTDIVFSDGMTIRCVGVGGERPFGVRAPGGAPAVAAQPGGAVPAGTYMVSIGFANNDLEISPLTPAVMIDAAAGSKLVLTQLPTTWPPGASMLLIYVTQPNGTTLLVEKRLSAPAASVEVAALLGSGMQATTYLARELPAGRILRFFGSRLYSVGGNTVWYSDVFSPALCSPTRSYVQFNAPVTMFEPCDDGVFLSADETYWLAGDIEATTPKVVSPTAAVFGSACTLPQTKQVVWMSGKGLVRGSAGGEVELLQDENVAVAPAESGASIVLEHDGQRHAVSSLLGAHASSTAATSYMDAEVIRKGTTL